MKITNITPVVVNAGMRNWVFVKVETSEPGLYGWGEATLEWKTRGVTGTIEDLRHLLTGKDPLAVTQLSEIMNKHSFWKLGIIGKTAVSGIDIALWDIKAKWLNVPVWQLLGGKVRNVIRTYTHLGMGEAAAVYSSFSTDTVVEKALRVVEEGYDAVKVVFIPYMNYLASPGQVKQVENMMGGLRQALGDEIDIMVDFHGRPASAGAALDFIKVLEPFRPLFVEEVIQHGGAGAMKAIREKAGCPLAAGERLTAFSEFEPYFRELAIDVAQPDLCHCGGFTEALRIGAGAATAGIGLAPHNPMGPVAGAAAIHYAAAMPNFIIQERMDAVPWFYDVAEGASAAEKGCISVPDKPGLGIEINEKVAARYPFKQEPLSVIERAVLPDGTVVHW